MCFFAISIRLKMLAVMSLRRMGEMRPTVVKPVLMEIIRNKNEHPIVRMISLIVLPR